MPHGHRELAPLSRWLALCRMSRSARKPLLARVCGPCVMTITSHPHHTPQEEKEQQTCATTGADGQSCNSTRSPPDERRAPCGGTTGANHHPDSTPPATTGRSSTHAAQRLGLTTTPTAPHQPPQEGAAPMRRNDWG